MLVEEKLVASYSSDEKEEPADFAQANVKATKKKTKPNIPTESNSLAEKQSNTCM